MSSIDFHRSGYAMARVLVQYIADPKRVRKIVQGEWSDAPSVEVIAAMRARFDEPAEPAICFKLRRHQYATQMERANQRFLAAMERAGRKVARG
jgi:hypothetical protein